MVEHGFLMITKAMDNNSKIVSFIRSIGKNRQGAQLIAEFEVELKKGTAKNRSEAYNRFFNEETGKWATTKVTRYKNITFQRNYTGSVENRSDSNESYQVEAPKGKHWVEGCEGILLQADSNPDKYYIRISENANTKCETTYYVNGKEATDDDKRIISEYGKSKSYTPCKKQVEFGVDPEHTAIVKDITVDKIIMIKFGNLAYINFESVRNHDVTKNDDFSVIKKAL